MIDVIKKSGLAIPSIEAAYFHISLGSPIPIFTDEFDEWVLENYFNNLLLTEQFEWNVEFGDFILLKQENFQTEWFVNNNFQNLLFVENFQNGTW